MTVDSMRDELSYDAKDDEASGAFWLQMLDSDVVRLTSGWDRRTVLDLYDEIAPKVRGSLYYRPPESLAGEQASHTTIIGAAVGAGADKKRWIHRHSGVRVVTAPRPSIASTAQPPSIKRPSVLRTLGLPALGVIFLGMLLMLVGANAGVACMFLGFALLLAANLIAYEHNEQNYIVGPAMAAVGTVTCLVISLIMAAVAIFN